MTQGLASKANTPAFLWQGGADYVDMTEVIRRGSAIVVDATDTGVLLLETRSRAYMMAAQDQPTAQRLLPKLGAASLFVAHEDFYLAQAQAQLGLRQTMVCRQAAYLQAAPPAMPHIPYVIRPVAPEDTPQVRALYSHAIGEGYIEGRIAAGELYGAYDAQVLAGFIGLHEEGSMGMLEVAPAYRRQSIGEALMAYLIGALMRDGRVPFSQIEQGNDPSAQLHEKLGFATSDRLVYWLE